MSFPSPTERPSRSRSVSPVSTGFQSHSAHRSDAQPNGYQRIPHALQQKCGIEMTTQYHLPTAGRGLRSPDIEVHPPDSQSPNPPLDEIGKFRTIVGKFWLWEILAYCFSLACMGAVIGVLAYEDGKQLDQWGFRVTPNAVVSFIATLAKSAFLLAITETISQLKWLHFHDKSHKLSDLQLFDEASRGPFGSLKLLIARHKNTLLASCAACIMLAALFVDPFVQLVFSFPSRGTLAATKNTSFSTAQLYDPNQYVLDAHNTQTGSVGTGMQAAILKGLYNDSPQPFLSCPTGNCTWTDLTTLGICGSCDDITDQIQTNCPGRTVENNGQYECDYTMPLNLTLSGWINTVGASGIDTQTRWNSSATGLDILYTAPPPSTPALLTVFEAIQLPEKKSETDGLPPPKGSRCTFVFCAKTYAQINVTKGIPSVSVPTEDILMLGGSSNGPCGPHCGPEFFEDMIPNSSVSSGGNQSNFRVNVADYANIQAYLQELFSSGWNDIGGSTRPISAPPVATAPDVGRELAFAQDLNQTIRAIAESMTEAIRTGPNSTSQAGQSYIEKTFIEIRWGWLAYPIVLMFLTLILLVVVIVETHRRGAIAWKSSSLAVLFHKLDGWEMPERGFGNNQELDRLAEGMRGRLFDAGDHPAFTKAD